MGGNPRKDQPIIGHRLRKAAVAGASVMFINPVDYSYTFEPAHKAIVTPARMVQSLAGVAAALLQSKKARAPHALRPVIDKTLPDATEQAMAQALSDAGQAAVLLGIGAGMHPAFSTLRALAVLVAIGLGLLGTLAATIAASTTRALSGSWACSQLTARGSARSRSPPSHSRW